MVLEAIRGILVSAVCFCALQVQATEIESILGELNEHQTRILQGYHQPAQMSNDIHSLSNGLNREIVSLVSVQITADTLLMQGSAVELGAHYGAYSTEITIKTPLHRTQSFQDAIRVRSQMSPEKLIDKMVIDGAVSLNFTW